MDVFLNEHIIYADVYYKNEENKLIVEVVYLALIGNTFKWIHDVTLAYRFKYPNFYKELIKKEAEKNSAREAFSSLPQNTSITYGAKRLGISSIAHESIVATC